MRWSWGFFHLCNRLAEFQKLDNKLYWQDCRKIILLYCCWWEYEFGRILMEGYQTVSFKYISHWPSSSTSRNLCYIYTNAKWIKFKDVTCSMVVMEKICQQPKCSSTGDWLSKLWYILTMEYYENVEKELKMINVLIWKNL